MKRTAKPSFARALRTVRTAREKPQESFDQVSSRTYISALERGIKQPTLGKVDSLAEVLEVHPITLLVLAYCPTPTVEEARKLCRHVEEEIRALGLPRDD